MLSDLMVVFILLQCARLCLETTSYVCRSISYTADQRECLLSDQNSGISTPAFSLSYDYYELKSQIGLSSLKHLFSC